MERKLFENVGYQSISIDYDIFNYVMPIVSGTEWKILCLMFLRTAGFRDTWAAISYTEIQDGTGIGSRTTVSKGLKELLDRGMILCRSKRSGHTITTNEYAINRNYAIEVADAGSTESVPSPENGDTISNTIVKDNTIALNNTIVLKKEKKVYKEKKERPGKKIEDYYSLLPDHLSESPEFKVIWKDWLAVRREKKVPVTKTAAKRQIALLSKYGVAVAVAMVDNSINRGWRGIFKLDDRHHLMRSGSGPLSDAGQSEMEPLRSA